ncbi:MAG: SDR family oxidoreductase [Caldilineaceae bacterium]|nr:SDR family oxidoreductase [Caldilineaceae bacterium]
MRLQEKRAIVTGAGMGMGRAAALRLAQEGARVVVADINETAGNETVEAIRAAGGDAIFVHADVAQAAQVEAMVAAAERAYGGLDIIFNNAAIQLIGVDTRAHELEEAIWDRIQSVNLKGVWLCMKYAITAMLKNDGRGGSIINNASPTGLVGCAPYDTAYSSAKAGVYGLTRAAAAAYAKEGIRINAIVPGPMDTPLITKITSDPQARAALEQLTPMGRLGKADEIAGLVAFLASDDAAYCTGGIYMADGGLTAV